MMEERGDPVDDITAEIKELKGELSDVERELKNYQKHQIVTDYFA